MSETEKIASHDDDAAVEAKRASLLNAKGELAVGRRETPVEDPTEARARKKRIVVGAVLCTAILVVVFVLLKMLATDISL